MNLTEVLKNKRGFTLIELIVVISILGILMTLAVPRLIGYTDMARQTADDQLASLYRNTFNILLGSGKIEVSDNVTITINPDGTVVPIADASAITCHDSELLSGSSFSVEKVQQKFIAADNNGDIPGFQSSKFSRGAVIEISADASVQVSAID